MESFFKNGNKPQTNKPQIRKVTKLVPVKPLASAAPAVKRPAAPANRFQLSSTGNSRADAPRKIKTAAQKALEPTRGVKRKSATPQPIFSDDEDDDNSSEVGASDSDASRKRIKSSVSSIDSIGLRRMLASESTQDDGKALKFVHAAALTSGDQAHKFVDPWDLKETVRVSLQYPSKSPKEKFELRWPKQGVNSETDEYKPMEDISETINFIIEFYLPDSISEKYTNKEDTDNCFSRRFHRAWQREDINEFANTVSDFNHMLKPYIEDGTVTRELQRQSSMHLQWISRILDQVYSRTVSPRVEKLRAYKNGGDNVYGELLPRFVSKILRDTRITHEQVFLDLGSGVGNVVLQAALEVGCESWGIEMMNNPCDLAELQAREFPARAKLWGLNVGAVHLLRGDFTDNREIAEVIKRADVVLVNNQAFTPALNNALMNMFLDLKEGAQVVSLKPFVPKNHKITSYTVNAPVNMFTQRQAEYFSGSVSWTDRSGYYYYATKDSRPLKAFKRKHNLQA